ADAIAYLCRRFLDWTRLGTVSNLRAHRFAPQLAKLALQRSGLLRRQLRQGSTHVEVSLFHGKDSQLEHHRLDERSIDFTQVFTRLRLLGHCMLLVRSVAHCR